MSETRSHFFGAYEYVDRSLITGGQVITVDPAAAQTLGITLPASGVIPAHQKVNFLFGKTDYQINTANRLSARYFLFKNSSASNIAGGLTTTDRATDFTDRMDSASAQLVSSIGSSTLNELRVQYARRHQFRTLADSAADGPAITVSGVANFGGPRIGDGNSVGFDFNQGIWQVIDNMTWLRGKHSFKAGIDAQFIADDRVKGERFLYTFPNSATYLAAKSGAAPLGYTNLQQDFGDLNAGVQLRVLRLLCAGRLATQPDDEAAVRAALRRLRRAVGASVRRQPVLERLHDRQEQPRASRRLVLVARRPGTTVLRASTGLMFEPPLLDFYDNAIMNNGDPISYTATVAGTAPGAPAFPGQPCLDASGFRAAAPEHHSGRRRTSARSPPGSPTCRSSAP